MQCNVRQDKGYAIIDIRDEVVLESDMGIITSQVESLIEKGTRKLALQFPRNSLPSSASLATLIWAAQLVKQVGGTFAIVCNNPEMDKIVEEFGLDDLMDVAYTTEALV